MGGAVLLFRVSCVYSIVRSLLGLLWALSPWRRLLVPAVLALALVCCRNPEEMRKNHQ